MGFGPFGPRKYYLGLLRAFKIMAWVGPLKNHGPQAKFWVVRSTNISQTLWPSKYLHDLPKIHIVNKTRPPIKPAPPIVPAPQRKLFTKTRGD